MHTQAYNHTSDNDSKAIASTHNCICLHNKRHLPPQQTAFANTTKDICPRTPRHLPPQPTAFVSTTQGICLHNSRTPRPKTIASMHKCICLHNLSKGICRHSRRHLPTQPKTSTHALQGICPHNQLHSSLHNAFASKIHALEGICLPLQPNSHATTMPGHSAWERPTPSKNVSCEKRH